MDLESAARCLGLQGTPAPAGLTAAEVVKAYRQECLAAHPDKGGDAARFQQLTAGRDALLAALDATAAGQRQQQERTERRVLAALRSLTRLQEQHPPAQGHALSIAAERRHTKGADVDCPVLAISGTAWRKVLVPTGHLLAAPDGLQDHWAWPLPQALHALQRRFASTSGCSLACSSDSVAVVRCAADGQLQESSGAITAAQIASGEWQAAVDALQLLPATAQAPATAVSPGAASVQHVDNGPSTPSSSAADAAGTHQPGSPAAAAAGGAPALLPPEVQAAAERAAAIVSEFEHVFGSPALLQAIGRQQTAGSEVSRQLFKGAAAGIRSHYGLPSAAIHGGSSLQALLALIGGSLGTSCCKQALQRLADELVQSVLPVLALEPQGLPAQLTPDVPAAPQPSSIVVHCRRFGCSEGCLARYSPGVSVHGLYVDGIARGRACDNRSKDGYRCQPCSAVAPQPDAGKKRPAALQQEREEEPLPPPRSKRPQQQPPEERCAALLLRFKLAVATGSNTFFPALLAADGRERCAAGAARSACSRQAALAYFDQLLGSLGGSSSLGRGPSTAACAPQACEQQASAAEAAEEAGAAAETAAAEEAEAAAPALTPADAAEYVKLAEGMPQLRGSLRACKRQGPSCCGVGKARKFVRCLQSWNALSGECAACWDALYAPPSGGR